MADTLYTCSDYYHMTLMPTGVHCTILSLVLLIFSACMYDIASAIAANLPSPGSELHPENATEAADTGIGESWAENYMKFWVDVCS